MSSSFRPDIQGLRAIAVLLVVAFHAGLPLSGGFVGVDVFFVISGFVITQMLSSELDTNGFIDFRRFYRRRINRLLPALATMTVGTLPFTVLATDVFSGQLWALRTAAASSVFMANVYLWLSGTDYFEPLGETNPFLHTWSLSVEEQFYFITPVLLAMAWRLASPHRRPRWTAFTLVGVVSALSLAVSVALFRIDPARLDPLIPSARVFGFYGIVSRFWELGAGVLVGLLALQPSSLATRRVTLVVGLALLAYATIAFDHTTDFPGGAALVPVLATVCLILARSSTFTHPLLVWVGDRSYGWYLWHWPAIIFARVFWPTSTFAPLLAAAFSLGLATLSFRWIETPLRHADHRHLRALVACCIVAPCALTIGLSLGAKQAWGIERPEGWSAKSVARARRCIEDTDEVFPGERCVIASPMKRGVIALVGDSHSASISDAVVDVARERGFDVAIWTRALCPFTTGYAPQGQRQAACVRLQSAWKAWLQNLHPALVISASYAVAYVDHDDRRLLQRVGGPAARSRDEALDMWADGMEQTARWVDEHHLQWLALHAGVKLPPLGMTTVIQPVPTPIPVRRADADALRDGLVVRELAIADHHQSMHLFDPFPSLCAETECAVAHSGRWLYMDDNHLSPDGAALLRPRLAEAIDEALNLER